MTRFEEMFRARTELGNYVCVGLDPDHAQLPECEKRHIHPVDDILDYTKLIVEATHHVAAAFKPQLAYYEAYGSRGIEVLEQVCEHIRRVDSSIPIILDYKRGDIGRTSEQYVKAAERLGVDAVTVSPYLGREAMMPFLDQTGMHIFVLGRTSNDGAEEFQGAIITPFVDRDTGKYYVTKAEAKREGVQALDDLQLAGQMPLYEFVALRVASSWNANNNCGLVVGATATEELGRVRELVGGHMLILVPGIGTQGGDLEGSIRLGHGHDWIAQVFNNSSAIMFAYKKGRKADGAPYEPHEWIEAAADAANAMNDAITALV